MGKSAMSGSCKAPCSIQPFPLITPARNSRKGMDVNDTSPKAVRAAAHRSGRYCR